MRKYQLHGNRSRFIHDCESLAIRQAVRNDLQSRGITEFWEREYNDTSLHFDVGGCMLAVKPVSIVVPETGTEVTFFARDYDFFKIRIEMAEERDGGYFKLKGYPFAICVSPATMAYLRAYLVEHDAELEQLYATQTELLNERLASIGQPLENDPNG